MRALGSAMHRDNIENLTKRKNRETALWLSIVDGEFNFGRVSFLEG
jgi:hypothetical protein